MISINAKASSTSDAFQRLVTISFQKNVFNLTGGEKVYNYANGFFLSLVRCALMDDEIHEESHEHNTSLCIRSTQVINT